MNDIRKSLIPLSKPETIIKRRDPRKTILLVDDDEFGPRESLKLLLKAFYHVELAEDGTQALEVLERRKIDLLILDLKVPDLSGETLLKIIKRKNPEMEVIVIRGNLAPDHAADGVPYRVTDFIIKPFTTTQLLNTINTVLDKKRRREELKEFLSEIGRAFGMDLPLGEIIKQIKEQIESREKNRAPSGSTGAGE